MRSPPAGMSGHSLLTSNLQIVTITKRLCGKTKGRTVRGATVGAGAGTAAAEGGAEAGVGCGGFCRVLETTGAGDGVLAAGGREGATAVGGGTDAGGGLTPLTAVLHDPDSFARLRLRHSSASLPPGWTPEQFAMKSDRQEARIAAI
jgi:hypothetical protein